jgi:hypothetical protein
MRALFSTWRVHCVWVQVPYYDLRGDAGDLYLFNSEHVHSTPTIRGSMSRGVLSSIVGMSAAGKEMELWG